MSDIDLSKLPKTYYRVSVKAIIKDESDRLLVFRDRADKWEMPGGGLEHGESVNQCIQRELGEEIKVMPHSIGSIQFTYLCINDVGSHKLCLALPVSITSQEFTLGNDDIVETRYVTREEFQKLTFQTSEDGVQGCVDQIWPSSLM